MFKEDKPWMSLVYWFKYKPEDELYYKLEKNPYYPFKEVGDGYYYVVVQSDRAAYGIGFLLVCLLIHILSMLLLGHYGVIHSSFIIAYIVCILALRGRIAWRELIISRHGRGSYMLRVMQNQEKLLSHDLRNVYIRLTKKDDSTGDPYFWLNLSGYELDDYRITRMTKAEGPLRIMGMKLAYRLGINYFDWKDESEEHVVFHYKTYSRLTYHVTEREIVDESGKIDGAERDEQESSKTLLAVPTRPKRSRTVESEEMDKSGATTKTPSHLPTIHLQPK